MNVPVHSKSVTPVTLPLFPVTLPKSDQPAFITEFPLEKSDRPSIHVDIVDIVSTFSATAWGVHRYPRKP